MSSLPIAALMKLPGQLHRGAKGAITPGMDPVTITFTGTAPVKPKP